MARYEIRIQVSKALYTMAEEIAGAKGEKCKSKALRPCVWQAIKDEHSAWVEPQIKKG